MGRLLDAASRWLKIIGAFCLTGMAVLTCIDVVGRFFNRPVFGAVELVGFMATLTVAAGLPYTHQVRGHIGVEILVRGFSARTQSIIECLTILLSLVLFALVAWQMAEYAQTMARSGEVTMNLGFPEYVIIYAVAFCFSVFFLAILQDFISSIAALRRPR